MRAHRWCLTFAVTFVTACVGGPDNPSADGGQGNGNGTGSSGNSSSGDDSGGGLTCTGSSVSNSATACSYSTGRCTDGNTYRVTCAAGATNCTCEVNGSQARNTSERICGGSTADLRAKANAQCGWTLR